MNTSPAPANPAADAIFIEALERSVGQDRAAFLDEACGTDAALRGQVEAMLKDDAAADEFFDDEETRTDASERGSSAPPRGFMAAGYKPIAGEEPGDVIGHYHLVEVLGEGGFGTVWQAQQAEPVRRQVALKIIKPGMDTREVLARFEHERQALAMMDHPGIARVFEAGATAAGRPYFAMELITGEPVTKYCDRQQLDTSARLRLVVEICAAVQHAHQKGIIHRDLKPSNVLVTEQDGRPAVKVIDFGIAKAVNSGADSAHYHTRADQFIGTPAYMSPEQASLDGRDVDTRSDIYSLGVLLYQLLTGSTPFEGKTSRGASLEEIRRIIRDEEPVPPSTAVSRLKAEVLTGVLQKRKTVLRELSQLLRRDLDWIVMKALEKDRARRYESASGLAADIRRYLAGEPVTARPATFGYRAGKFIRRRKGQVATAALVLISLLAGLVTSTSLFLREKAALARESSERAKAQRESLNNAQTARWLSGLLEGASPEKAQGTMPTLLDVAEAAATRVARGLEDQPAVEATLRNTIGSTFFSLGRFPEAKAQYEAGHRLALATAGENDRLTLRLRGNLANILHAERDYAAAEAENRAILAIRLQEFPPDDIETLATRDNLATEISKQGRYAEAAEEYRSLLAVQQVTPGPEHADTLRTRMALANTLTRLCLDEKGKVKDAAQLAKAEAEYRNVVAAMTRASGIGERHPLTLEARYGLADVLHFLKRFPDAEKEHREVHELRLQILPKGHKKTFQSQAGIGRALYGAGQMEQAAAVFQELTEAQNATPSRDESDYQSNLAWLKWCSAAKDEPSR
jgi:serine/threonine protein kinase/tetratricopeptide (TPR) repeat protein